MTQYEVLSLITQFCGVLLNCVMIVISFRKTDQIICIWWNERCRGQRNRNVKKETFGA